MLVRTDRGWLVLDCQQSCFDSFDVGFLSSAIVTLIAFKRRLTTFPPQRSLCHLVVVTRRLRIALGYIWRATSSTLLKYVRSF